MCHPVPSAGKHVASAAKPWLAPTLPFTLLAAQEKLPGLGRIPASSPLSSCPAVTHAKSSCPILACSGVHGELGQLGNWVSPAWGPPGIGPAGAVRAEGCCSRAAVLPLSPGSDLEWQRQHPHASIASLLKWEELEEKEGSSRASCI